MGGSCGYENKTLTQSLSECHGGVRGIGVWLKGMRIPTQQALWLKMFYSLSQGREHEYTVHVLWNCVGTLPFFHISNILYYTAKEVKEEEEESKHRCWIVILVLEHIVLLFLKRS